jgi:hypothetical protein
VRTNRWTFHGRYTAKPTEGGFAIRYDPEPLPPIYPGQQLDRMSASDQRRILGEQLTDFRWPVEMAGMYRKEGDRLVITLQRGPETIEWRLSHYTRPKF